MLSITQGQSEKFETQTPAVHPHKGSSKFQKKSDRMRWLKRSLARRNAAHSGESKIESIKLSSLKRLAPTRSKPPPPAMSGCPMMRDSSIKCGMRHIQRVFGRIPRQPKPMRMAPQRTKKIKRVDGVVKQWVSQILYSQIFMSGRRTSRITLDVACSDSGWIASLIQEQECIYLFR